MTIQSILTSYSVRKSSNAKMLAWGITAVFPLILLFAGIYFRIILGDFPNDPDYAYLLNGINILRWHAPAQIDHPGTPVQLIAGLISGFVWRSEFHSTAGSLRRMTQCCIRSFIYLPSVWY